MKGRMEFDELSNRVIGCALEVHRELGPGLLESSYENCMACEMDLKGIPFQMQKPMPVQYKASYIDCGYRLDFVVADQLIVELKAVAAIEPVHLAQMLTYMKLAKARIGLLINFNVPQMRDGIKRFVRELHPGRPNPQGAAGSRIQRGPAAGSAPLRSARRGGQEAEADTGAAAGADFSGRVIRKVAPWPSALWAEMEPPWRWTIFRQRESPMPEPSYSARLWRR